MKTVSTEFFAFVFSSEDGLYFPVSLNVSKFVVENWTFLII